MSDSQKETLTASLVLLTVLEARLGELRLDLHIPVVGGLIVVREACHLLRQRWLAQQLSQALGLDD
jgi:hypothetical protein